VYLNLNLNLNLKTLTGGPPNFRRPRPHVTRLLAALRDRAILIQFLISAISRRAAAERIAPMTRALTGHVVGTVTALCDVMEISIFRGVLRCGHFTQLIRHQRQQQ